MPSKPNRPEQVAPLNPRERHLDTSGSGNAAQDGYTCIARRPRSRFFEESVSKEQADRIEQIMRPMPPSDMDSY